MTIAGKEVVVTKFKPRNQRQTLVAWTNIYMKISKRLEGKLKQNVRWFR